MAVMVATAAVQTAGADVAVTDCVGTHGLLDLYDCDAALLSDAAFVESALRDAALQSGATILAGHFHHFGAGMGVTGVLLLAESHISIHTWPEHGFAAVDIFLCGTHDMAAARDCLVAALAGGCWQWRVVSRGDDLIKNIDK